MSRRVLGVIAAALFAAVLALGVVVRHRAPAAQLRTVGPRLLSNQTAQPLRVTGEQLRPGLSLRVQAPSPLELPLEVVDEHHAFTVLPPVDLPAGEVERELEVSLVGARGEGRVRLTVANDRGFPELSGLLLTSDGAFLAALSSTTDTLFVVDASTGRVRTFPTFDGPTSVAEWRDASGHPYLVVAHAFTGALALFDEAKWEAPPRRLPARDAVRALVVQGQGAFLADEARREIVAVELGDDGHELWHTRVDFGPRTLAPMGDGLAVGAWEAGMVDLLDAESGRVRARVAPGPGTPIVGGGTERFADQVIGGTAPRALAFAGTVGKLLVASIGPNVGPNAARMEVSMNGGIGVVDPASGRFLWHLGFGAGVPSALAIDEARGRVYQADLALGRIRVLSLSKLCESSAAAKDALVTELPVTVPATFPLVRPAAELGVKGRAGVELHSGPVAIAVSQDGLTLWVLSRFTGTLTRIELPTGQARARIQLVDPLTQPMRRLGEVLYFADVGKTAMSCDACHPDGRSGGAFFAKTEPLRIYRSTSILGARDTPPYFTPPSTRSLAETAQMVGSRNRFHNPEMSVREVDALALYTSLLAPLPNPFVEHSGAPSRRAALPDGVEGDAVHGMALFDAHCQSCHPEPALSLDQDPATRGKLLEVGTPHLLPLRPLQQDPTYRGFGTPSLAGAWSNFPMLSSAAAGLDVEDGARAVPSLSSPLSIVLERFSGPQHGNAQALSEADRHDLLAYLYAL